MMEEVLGIETSDREEGRWRFAGLNAHRISGQTPDGAEGSGDVCAFRPLGGGVQRPPDAAAELMFVCWSQVVCECPSVIAWLAWSWS